jgi:hypothetical protein
MKNNKKLLLIVIIGISFIIALIFSFSYQRTYYQIIVSHSNSQNTSTNNVKLDKSYEIVYHGLDDSNRQNVDSSAYRIDVFVQKDTSFGILRYLPIYKPISFKSRISYKWKHPESICNTDSMTFHSGQFDIRGNYNLLGAHTKTDVEQLINELIIKSITTQIQKEIRTDIILEPKTKANTNTQN